MFISLIGTNEALTPVVKMHYLRTQLKGDAADLIANLPITGESFATAWDLLVARFDNPRLLLSAHLDHLFSIKKIASRSAKALNELLNANTKALNGIESLNITTETWDPLLVHLTVSKLDDRMRESWENRLGSTTEFSKYSELKTFLTGRARAMETVELNTTTPPALKLVETRPTYAARTSTTRPYSNRSFASANLSTIATSIDSSGFCAICSENHFVLFCPIYRAKTSEERIEAVKHHRLCFNCLGRHRITDCRTTKCCQKCGERHHTSIHLDRFHSELPFNRFVSTISSSTQTATGVSGYAAKQ
jgi:hypothetical protein